MPAGRTRINHNEGGDGTEYRNPVVPKYRMQLEGALKICFVERLCRFFHNVETCETVSEQRAARCIAAPGGPGQRRRVAHPGIPGAPR
jgi:hypothetical protein